MITKTPPSIIQQAISNAIPGLASPASEHYSQVTLKTEEVNQLVGAERSEEKRLLVDALYITSKPPREVAILHVYANGQDQYCVWGFNAEIPVLKMGPLNRPYLVLGEMVQDRRCPELEMPHTILQLMREFSFSQIDMRVWLTKLHKHFGSQLRLIIADYTDFEIPWEMIDLSNRQYVGALITVARWQHVIGDESHLSLEVKPDECCGHIISYLNREELDGTGPEYEVLEDLNALSFEDPRPFLKQLQQDNNTTVGLVFMACHGIFKNDIRKVALGSIRNEDQRLGLLSLRGYNLKLLKCSQVVVFINACHSGRLQTEGKYLRDTYRRGFAELFLSKGAKGVIGTLGGVNDTFAAEIARDLLKEASLHPEMPIATILCKLRASAVDSLPSEPQDQDLLRFIYTFMYVYYGNPMTVLKLMKRVGS